MRTPVLVYILLVLTALFWGGSWVVVKQLTAEVDPIFIATVRFLIVSVFFLPVAVWLHKKGEKVKISDLGTILLLGIFGVTLLYILQYYGISLTTAINASLMITFNPTMTLILSAMFLDEKINLKKILAIIIAFLGAFLVITNGSIDFEKMIGSIEGSLLTLGSTTCWAIYTVINKKTLNRHSPLFITVYTSIIGTILLIPVALLASSPDKLFTLSINGWLGLLYLAVLCSVFGYSAWSYSLEKLDASKVAIFNYLIPLFAVVLSYLFLGESLTPYSAFGAFLIFAGVYYSTRVG